jgi:hypothetical protein
MILRAISIGMLGGALCAAADKLPTGSASNDNIEVAATLHNGKEAVRAAVGSDLGGYIVIVGLVVTPKGGKSLAVSPDDFILRSDRDGQRTGPFAPSQIAGKGALVVSSRGGAGGMMMDESGPVWGGTMGRPRRLGGEGGAMGNTSVETETSVHTTDKEKDDPVLATLKAKALPMKETAEPVSGLLYFLMEGKHKTKQLEMYYKGPAGNLSMRFRD